MLKVKLNYKLTKKDIIRAVTGVGIIVVVFFAGLNIGNGNISFANGGQNGGLPNQLNYASVTQEYQVLKANFDGKLTQKQLLNGLKQGLASAANDPYTVYFTNKEAKVFNNELNNAFSGIGVELSRNSQKEIIVMAPLKGSPAAKAGLQSKDIIAGINGKPTAGMSLNSIVNDIRGKAGTKVTLAIISGTKKFNVVITRQHITVPSVNYKILSGNIGYISISTFANDTASLMQKAARYMVSNHVKGIILDLRNNPGGLVTAAVATCSEWLKPGQEVMQERRGTQVLQTYNATGGDILQGIPTAVLVNGGSASASEITAGALHDHHDAYLIGTKTFGKGVVQQLINLSDGGELKVTVASWYRPDGQNIEKIGITPDKVVKPATNGVDNQLTAAENYINSK
jgi:carboxyl-terminal processing protease